MYILSPIPMLKPLQLHIHKIFQLHLLMEGTNLFHFRIFLAILLLHIPATLSEDVADNIYTDKTALLDSDLRTKLTADPSSDVCSWIGVSCTTSSTLRVTALNLSGMELQGAIPPQLGNLSALVSLDLSHNTLDKGFPVEICNHMALEVLNLSNNMLSGRIPVGGKCLTSLTHLSLANNQFNGSIPVDISPLKILELLDLRFNNLSGEFPGMSLKSLSRLKHLNVSNNLLVGKVPCEGNLMKLQKDCFQPNWELNFQHCPLLYTAKRVYLFACAFMGIAIGLIALCCAFVPLKHVVASVNSYKQLHEATNGFHENNEYPKKGRFSWVYKGSWNRPNLEKEEQESRNDVAVKVFKLDEIELNNFEAESERLRRIDHQNLTRVIDSCSVSSLAMAMGSGTCSEFKAFKALVMKFMDKGSLDECLRSKNCSMDIKQRMEIMIGVASGLEHLHKIRLFHGDLKPSNVLLDEDMVAHLSDFGITKSEKKKKKQPPENLPTPAYYAPEYELKGSGSAKSDVYSFGIILMETFTIKKPTDSVMNFREWVKEAFEWKNVIQVVDAELIKEGEETFKAKTECVSSILQLAIKCSEESAEKRLDIKEVVEMLKTIKAEYLATKKKKKKEMNRSLEDIDD